MTWYDIIIAIVILVLLLLVIKRILRRPKPILPVQYSKKEPSQTYHLRDFDQESAFNYKNPFLDGQSEEWQKRMAQIGPKLDKHDVTHAYFIHGTFVGDDPFGLIPALRRIYPNMDPSTEDSIRKKIKKGYSHLTKDTGNFLDEYVDLFRLASGAKTKCKIFTWSSANHHLARVNGALNLIDTLDSDLPDIPPSRVLLVGHSHGGQTFSLFSHLINNSPLGFKLWEMLIRHGVTDSSTKAKTAKLKKFDFDLVTLGTPYRYPWRLTKKMRLVNIINHRGKGFLAEKPLGFWKTAGGDYVQQWGIAGSDTLASSSSDRNINREIDQLLGLGVDPKSWLENVAKGMRIQDSGTSYLVDYKDNSLVLPNFMKSIFGHGVYTRYETMLFNAEVICKEFYND